MSRFVAVTALLCLSSAAALAAPLGPQQLARGQSTTIQTDYAIGDVAITDQSICDYLVKDSRRAVYLNARKPGSVTLTLWDVQGVQRDVVPIRIVAADVGALDGKLTQTVGQNGQLRFVQQGDDVVVEGEVGSEEEAARIQSLAAGQPGVRTAVRLSPKAMQGQAVQVERAIHRPGVSARVIKNRLVLEGVVYSAEAYAHAEKIARLFDPNLLNLLEVRDTKRTPGNRPLVQLDVYFMEVKKSALRRFGIQWTPGAGSRAGGGSEGAGGGGFFGGAGQLVNGLIGTAINLVPKLLFAREKGLARVLEHPNFVVKSGETVDFFSGTEVPYFSAQNVQFKEVGIKLQAEPIAYGDDIDLKITARISSLSAGVRQGIDTRTITTNIYSKNGQAVVLGGLFNNGDAKGWNRVPEGIDTSSALFTLVKSKDFQSSQSDFVVFLVPQIVGHPPSADTQLQEWMRLNEEITRRSSKKKSVTRDTWDEKANQGTSHVSRLCTNVSRVPCPDSVIAMPSSLQPTSRRSP